MFVSIEGCISAGKSTLSKLLSDCLEYKLVLEDYKSNRFLENFYTENNKEISFATEMEFLLLHYQQLINIDYSKNIISDFSFFSNIVFGRLNLEEQAIEYLSKKDIFNDGSKKDYDMREMTIIEAILKYFNEIDNIVLKLFIYDLVSEKQKRY